MSPSLPSSLSAKRQSDYFWLSFSVTWTWPSGVVFIFQVYGGFCSLNTQKDMLQWKKHNHSTEVLVFVSWTFKPDVRLVWSLTEKGKESKICRQRGRGWQSMWFWGGFQPCLFSTVQQQKGTVSIPLKPSLPGLQLIAALQRERKGEQEWEKQIDGPINTERSKTLQNCHTYLQKVCENKSNTELINKNHF